MMRKIKNIKALKTILMTCSVLSLTLQLNAAQYYRLHHLDVYNMGGYNRVVIQCDGPVKYIHKHFSAIDRLSVYLRYTQIDLTQKTFFYKNGMIKAVKVVQWKESPPVTRVDIYLNGALDFKIHQSIDGLLNIDFSNGEKKASKELVDPGYSQISRESSFKQ